MRLVFRLLFIFALLVAGLLLMRLVYKVRIEELGQNLESAADKTMALRSLGLIAKYRLIQSRMKNGESIALLRREASVSYAGSDSVLRNEKEKLPAAYELGLGIVNLVNAIAGAKPVSNRKKSRAELLMEEAYLYELQRNFAEAARTYDMLIAEAGIADGNLLSFARLHRGYCLSFGAERSRAAQDYRQVISTNTTGEYRLTAEVLLAYLEEFGQRADKIETMRNSNEKGNAYFNVGAYAQAIATLESLPGTAKTTQTNYLLGRSYEEVGRSEKALENYRQLIKLKPRSQFAKLANRRIYAMGSIYANGMNLVKESTVNAKETVPDQDLLRENKKSAVLAAAVIENQEITRQEIKEEKIALAAPEKSPSPTLKTLPVAVKKEQPAMAQEATAIRKRNKALPKPVKRVELEIKPASEASRAMPEPRVLVPPPAVNHDALTRIERKNLIQREARIDEIHLTDGNRLWGIILEENVGRISMLTVMGKVSIEKTHITHRNKIDSASAFQPRQ